jgi:hypothetical protein
MRKILFAVLMAAMMFCTGESNAGTYQIPPIEDAIAYGQIPGAPLGNELWFGTHVDSGPTELGYTFLKFNIPTYPGEVITSATLKIYQFSGSGTLSSQTAVLYFPNNTWSESTITWNNKPIGLGTKIAVCADGFTHVGWSSWSFNWDPSWPSTITLLLREDSLVTGKRDYVSKEDIGNTPYLEITTVPQNNPVPSVASLNPTSAVVGDPGFTLTVVGTNFVSGSVVRWNGLDRATTFVSGTQLTAAITAADIATVETASVTVYNPAPGGGTSNVVNFAVQARNPTATIASLRPAIAIKGGVELTLTVTGSNIISGSVVRWNGSDRVTTFVSTTQLTAAITVADIATAGTAQVTVFTPAPGGGVSDAKTFTIINPPPASVGVYRNGAWYFDKSGNGAWDGCSQGGQDPDTCYTAFGGLAFDIPVVGDWERNGDKRAGVYRQGMWYLDLDGSGTWSGCKGIDVGGADGCLGPFGGLSMDIPVVGDWDGNGTTKIGIYRQGYWYLDNGNGTWDGCRQLPSDLTKDICWGPFGGLDVDVPVVGDWSGNGKTKIGVYRQGMWYLDNSGNGSWDGCSTDGCLGPFGGFSFDIPVVGDWNGELKSRIGIYRLGAWYLDTSTSGNGQWNGCTTDKCIPSFGGLAIDKPVVK